jgi:protoporphyrinogen oxidase
MHVSNRCIDLRPKRVAILGAGALGLTAALRLAQRGYAVTVLEREVSPGGLAAGFRFSGDRDAPWLEKFYHHLFRSDRYAIGLIRELGLEDDLIWRHPRTVVFWHGKLHDLDSPRSLMRFSPLSVMERLRMGLVLAGLRALPDARMLEGRAAGSWLRRWMGYEPYRVVWGPLLKAKFGETAEMIGMPWFWARVHDRTSELGYLRSGFQHLYDGLAARVLDCGGEIRLSSEVREVRRAEGAFDIHLTSETLNVDVVISTLAPRLTAKLVPDLPEMWRTKHAWGQAYGAHCLILALDRPLTDAYWVNVNQPGFPFVALVEHTNYMDAADYGGRHIVYLGNYRPMTDTLFTASKSEVLADFLPHLRAFNREF